MSEARIKPMNVPSQHQSLHTIDSKEKERISLPPIRTGRAQVTNQDNFGSLPVGSTVEVELEATEGVRAPSKDVAESGPQGSIEPDAKGSKNLLDVLEKKGKEDKDAATADDGEKSGSREEGDEEELTEAEKEADPSWFYYHDKWTRLSPRSLWIFGHENPIRKVIIWIILHRFFDGFIVLLIMTNSIMLGIMRYDDPDNKTVVNQVVSGAEPVFVVAFTVECVLKIIGMGFVCDPGSYLQDPWNSLDFLVVVSSLLTEIPQMKAVSGMRTLRLMRPLRTLTTMPSMRILISTLFASVSQLGGVLVLAVFFFTIFAILGVSLWSGKIYYRCRYTEFPVDGVWPVDPTDNLLCSSERQCSQNRYCGSLAEASRNPKLKLKEGTDIAKDSDIEDLNFGITNFNNLGFAFLTIF